MSFFFGGGGALVPLFGFLVMSLSSGFHRQSGFCLIRFFAEASVMYITQDPPLVLHILTSLQPVLQPVTAPHASAEVGLSSDLNKQSPGQKTNVYKEYKINTLVLFFHVKLIFLNNVS